MREEIYWKARNNSTSRTSLYCSNLTFEGTRVVLDDFDYHSYTVYDGDTYCAKAEEVSENSYADTLYKKTSLDSEELVSLPYWVHSLAVLEDVPTMYVISAGVDWPKPDPQRHPEISGVEGFWDAQFVVDSFEDLEQDYLEQWEALPSGENKRALAREFVIGTALDIRGDKNILRQAIESSGALVKKNDTFIIYVSTHGGFIHRENYKDPNQVFIPEEICRTATLGNSIVPDCGNEYLYIDDDGDGVTQDNEVIKDDEFKSWFVDDVIPGNPYGTKWSEVNKLFILDACYSGGFADDEIRL